MSLRQQRFLNLIQAAERLVQRDQLLRAHIHRTCSAVASRRISPEEAIHDIGLQLRLYPDYDPAEKTIALERQWYDITHHRNDQEAARIARKRASDPTKRQRKTTATKYFENAEAEAAELQRREAQDKADLDAFNDSFAQSDEDIVLNADPRTIAEYERVMGKKWKPE